MEFNLDPEPLAPSMMVAEFHNNNGNLQITRLDTDNGINATAQ
jgi:hypothetical protein